MSRHVDGKVQAILKRRLLDARMDVLRELDEFERLKKEADEKSEIRELSYEEKALDEMVFPEALAFPIDDNFRLWCSVIPVPNFPTNFIRKCYRISMEQPTNIRPNTVKSLSTISTSFVESVQKNPREFKRMLFSMCVMHAVINNREKFGSFGWTQPYQFSSNDLQISIKMLAEICMETHPGQSFPFKLMRYLVADLNYGGKLTNSED